MSFFHSTGVHFDDAAQLDGFGRLRTSNPVTLHQSKQLYDKLPLIYDDQEVSGTGTSSTYNAAQSSTTIAVSNLTAGRRVRQTFERFNYQPGKSQLVMCTLLMGAGATGIIKRVGFFTDNNGIFLERNGATAVNLVVRTSTSGSPSDANSVAQASWNIDTFDGSGGPGNPSKVLLDLTKVQLFFIDFAWLGTSRVRCGFVINGILYYAHQFFSANVGTLAYMANPNLPIRYEISNSGAGPVASLVHICATVSSEAGSPIPGVFRSADNGITTLVILNNSNIFCPIAIRINPGDVRGNLNPHHIEVMCTTNSAFRWCLLLNPTVTGTAFSWNTITNSIVEFATPTNATTISGGMQVISGYSPAGANSPSVGMDIGDVMMGANIAGVPDVVAVGVQKITGTVEQYLAAIHWEETI